MRALGQPAETRVHVVEGPDTGVALTLGDEGRVYVIGRDASCDLPLADTDVSRAHVNVVRRGGTVLLRDLGSKNGVRLGDARLPADRDVPWRSGASVFLGGTTMVLEEPAAIALAELEAAEDEPMDPGDVPPPPLLPEEARAGMRRSEPDGSSLPPTVASTGPAQCARDEGAGRSPTDVAVVATALVLLGLSLAGLFWLLRT